MPKRKRQQPVGWAPGPPMMIPYYPPYFSPMPFAGNQPLPGSKVERPPMPPSAPTASSSASSSGHKPATNSTKPPIGEAFGALATWDTLPAIEGIKMVLLIDFPALIVVPGPNLHLVHTQTAKLLEVGLESNGWFDREDVLRQVLAEGRWNEAMVEVAKLACQSIECLVVINTMRVVEQTPIIKDALAAIGIHPHMFAYNDPLHPQRARKHQLLIRLWHYFEGTNLIYYENLSAHRDTRELRSQLQRVARPDRPLPQIFDVYNRRTNLDLLAERKIIDNIVASHPNLNAFVHTDKWVWRIVDYEKTVAALAYTGHEELIGDYRGRTIDYENEIKPLMGDRGKQQTLHATQLVASGSIITLRLAHKPVPIQLLVARLKHSVADKTWDVDFDLNMVLDVHRCIMIRQRAAGAE